ncbi:hypothetical protein L226DRAFT_49377 [Lentinus tigrinus ALCF2SS1-7]|uniref:uncharacterized protein n=1 Tax=Lentinus tigrinus ALCF2SS1-7 TaxID=1328758 RepID=UPI00116601B6|nr:hypothetical protein L226DRAFT_49377 [Lentinus tigrinus ALCF2SS1-7]
MDDIIEDIRSITLATSLYDAATALFCYDYCLTFGREVQYIWPLRLSVPSLLFFAVRYPALVNTAFIILDQTCWRGMTDELWLLDSMQLYDYGSHTDGPQSYPTNLSCVFLRTPRVRIMWAQPRCSRSRSAIGSRESLDLIGHVHPVGYCSVLVPSPYMRLLLSCTRGDVRKVRMVIARTSSVVADGLVLAITWSKTWNVRREAPPMNFASKITMVLMRDGTFYFTILLIINLVALSLSRAFQLIEAISTWIAVVTSIMMSRFILDLHAAARLHTVDDTSSPLTPPVFATAGTSVSSFFGVLTTDISVEPMDALSRASADI